MDQTIWDEFYPNRWNLRKLLDLLAEYKEFDCYKLISIPINAQIKLIQLGLWLIQIRIQIHLYVPVEIFHVICSMSDHMEYFKPKCCPEKYDFEFNRRSADSVCLLQTFPGKDMYSYRVPFTENEITTLKAILKIGQLGSYRDANRVIYYIITDINYEYQTVSYIIEQEYNYASYSYKDTIYIAEDSQIQMRSFNNFIYNNDKFSYTHHPVYEYVPDPFSNS